MPWSPDAILKNSHGALGPVDNFPSSIMLLRFTTVDMLNTSLIDVATGERAFEIVTEQLDETPRTPSPSSSQEFSPTSSVVLDKSMPTPSTSSVHWAQQPDSYSMKAKPCPDRRHTTITDASGKVLVDVDWKGRRPDITICGEKIGGLTELFGSSTIRFMPKVLAIPTRFDTEFVWIATGDTLSVSRLSNARARKPDDHFTVI
jgi:RNA-binding protein PNO1